MIRGMSIALASGLIALFAPRLHAQSESPGAAAIPASAALRPFIAAREFPITPTDAAVIRIDHDQWLRAGARTGGMVFEAFPLPGGRTIDIELQRFHITGPGTRFVLGGADGVDTPLEFDPSSITLYRGHAVGYPASRIFLSVAPGSTTARIDLGPGEDRFLLSDRSSEALPLRDGEFAVLTARPGGGLALPVRTCGAMPSLGLQLDHPSPSLPPPAPLSPRGLGPVRGMRHLQLAVDTDHAFFGLFDSPEAAATYILQLYAVVSDIYIRDVNTRIEVTFVRLWDTPTDPYITNNLLGHMGTQWGPAAFPGVVRDAVQLLSGRRNIDPAGQAWISALCGGNPHSWAAYILGYFVDPATPLWTNRDIYLAAHELGHNCGTGHTHDYGLDSCGNGALPARRGSIMSYCGQAYSGSDANYDLWFHEHTAQLMRNYMYSRTCIAMDCNANGVPDAADISGGTSQDANANNIPDECEDCNGNGVLDPADIASGFSADVNNNAVPDECERDCNGNNIPDTLDILANLSLDLNRNRVLDLCEGDCDGNGVADYNQIQANMSLDIDRNTILDECQRCTPEGPNDLFALDHAWNVYSGSLLGSGVWEFYAGTGVLMDRHGVQNPGETQDLVITPDRRVLVSSTNANSIRAYSADGADLGVFIPAGAGGLQQPTTMLLTGRGTLLVVSSATNSVLEFDAQTGGFIRPLITPADAPAFVPRALAFGPGGNLFVSSGNQIYEHDGLTGAFLRIFVPLATNGGLSTPSSMLFKPDGNLLVCSYSTNEILEFDGQSGAPLGRWNTNGVPGTLALEQPWCIRLGPDGDVYVSRSHAHRSAPGEGGTGELHISDVRIFRFDVRTGQYGHAYIMGDDTTLNSPSGFDFMPGEATDCNRNNFPDWCDLTGGRSRDINTNSRPDECDCLADWNSSGVVNSLDISAFLTAWLASIQSGTPNGDFNGDLAVNSGDISAFLTAWLAAMSDGC